MFSLWPDRMSGPGVNLPFHECKAKKNKKRIAKEMNLSSACFYAKPTRFTELFVPARNMSYNSVHRAASIL